MESKFRWRNAARKCPICGKETIIKGKDEYGGGWVCYKKKDGCGATFEDNDDRITGQIIGKVENTDIADVYNTVIKMSKKRAYVDATITACAASDIFTQDGPEDPAHPDPQNVTPGNLAAEAADEEGEFGDLKKALRELINSGAIADNNKNVAEKAIQNNDVNTMKGMIVRFGNKKNSTSSFDPEKQQKILLELADIMSEKNSDGMNFFTEKEKKSVQKVVESVEENAKGTEILQNTLKAWVLALEEREREYKPIPFEDDIPEGMYKNIDEKFNDVKNKNIQKLKKDQYQGE
jgi:hypothetical protein